MLVFLPWIFCRMKSQESLTSSFLILLHNFLVMRSLHEFSFHTWSVFSCLVDVVRTWSTEGKTLKGELTANTSLPSFERVSWWTVRSVRGKGMHVWCEWRREWSREDTKWNLPKTERRGKMQMHLMKDQPTWVHPPNSCLCKEEESWDVKKKAAEACEMRCLSEIL